MSFFMSVAYFFFFKQKTAYEMRISDWSSDVCSSDLLAEEMDIRTFERADGQIAILSGDSQFLLDRDPVTLSFTTSATMSPVTTGADIMLDNGFLPPYSITGSFGGGTVSGLVQLRDTILPLAQEQLDSLAFRSEEHTSELQ